MDALTLSNSSRAVFISSCNWRSSLDRPVSSPSKVARGCSTWGVLPASCVLGLVSWNGCWVDWVEPGELLGGVAWGEVCGEICHWSRSNGLCSHRPGRIFCFPHWGGALSATDDGCVLEVMYCEGEWGAVGEACCSCSSVLLRFRLSGSFVLVQGGTLGTTLLSSTSIMGGSWADSSALAALHSGSSLQSKRSGMRLPFSPSGKTTWPPYCSSCHTLIGVGSHRHSCLVSHQSWCQCGLSLDKGAWAMALFILA